MYSIILGISSKSPVKSLKLVMKNNIKSSISAKNELDNQSQNSLKTPMIIKTYYYYDAYGLKIKSELRLPELIASQTSNFDVEIKQGTLDQSPLTNLEQYFFCCESTSEGLYLFWQGIGTMLIAQGKTITLDLVADYDEARVRLFILGAALGAILHQRGYIVLHASAVAINHQAVIFTAAKGEGKSTMTATLHARGHEFMADDVVAIDVNHPQQPMVYPAFPQLKLWPDAVKQIGKDPDTLPKLIERLEKRDYLFQNFSLDPLPLKQIFVLGTDEQIAIKPLNSQETMLTLLRNVYVARFGSSLLSTKDPAYFLRLTQFAQQVSLMKLLRPRNLELVADVAATVEQYLADQAI